ncbi:lytic murein transglycosylase B [Motiliproteus sp. SC1-56]|uniref:lytic murein transglycosylase B n=1 Tax=Motiliproteus sp. SC1-56 TaxID=2799565 RepID=UPI00351CAFF8
MKFSVRSSLRGLIASAFAFALLPAAAADPNYAEHPEAKAFVDRMVAEGFERKSLEALIAEAERKESILTAIARPAEKRLNWGEYRQIFLGQSRIDQGVAFWNEHRDTVGRASRHFGVAPEVIVAIIGVETRYGRNAGSYRVIDALATLAFDYPPRSKFFGGQLRELLYLLREEKLSPLSLTGSYAGAMGYGQFIPSSYRNYAVDFDDDGVRDILSNPVDAIGSVANYFARHHWQEGQPVAVPAQVPADLDDDRVSTKLKPELTLEQWKALGVTPRTPLGADEQKATLMKLEFDDRPAEYWLGLENFYVITRYNRSHLYAMAVYQLSEAIREQWQRENG